MAKKILWITLIFLVFVAIAFFRIAPGMIDKSMNKVIHKASISYKVSWYDSIPFIADLHCDALLWDRDFLERNDNGHVDLPRMQEANAAFEVFTVVSKTPRGINYDKNTGDTDQIALLSFAQLKSPVDWFSIKSRALHQCEQLHQFSEDSKGVFRVIQCKKELQQFIRDRKTNHHLTAGMLGLEGAQCLEGDLQNLDAFYKAGVRYIGLAHFFDNEWAGSAHGVAKGGLTEKGKALIKKMESLNIIIDVAHVSPKTMEDIFAITSRPVILSHGGVKGTCDNIRNLSDSQLIEIGKRNGLIGIGMWEAAVCGNDIDATVNAIQYAVSKIGVDKVAMGSDFDGATITSYDITGFPLIVKALIKKGLSRRDIEKIMGGNVRDFMLKNLPD